MQLDQDVCYRAVKGRDRRFDGIFYTAVRTTGIYCRPSCPAITPRQHNVSFFRTAAGAQGAGYRACRRCLPDATPGSPEWDVAADVAARAMRLVADGVVEREGVDGLARALGYSTRQLNRVVTQQYGAGPLALARSRRAQTARVLIETTDLSFTDVAFAAGFASVRQFNDTVREVYAASPTRLRTGVASRRAQGPSGTIHTRIAVREPFAADALHHFLSVHVVRGLEAAGPGWYERAVRLPHGHGVIRVELADRTPGYVACTLTLADARDLAPATERTRRLLDADCDPTAVDEALGEDAQLAPLVADLPGLRVPGQLDGAEMAVQTVLGQQVSLAAARTAAARLVVEHGDPLGLEGSHAVSRLFPTMATLAKLDPETLPMPRSRGRALVGLARALDGGEVRLDRSTDRAETRAALLALPGIGPWTADYVSMRALGDPDAFLPTDLGVRNAAARLGIDDPARRSEEWRPWRSYALMRLWSVVLHDVSPPDAGSIHPAENGDLEVTTTAQETTTMWTVTSSPIGDLRIVARGGAITAIEFSPFRAPVSGEPLGSRTDDDPLLRRTVEQLAAYFAGDLTEFDLPLAPNGSSFQKLVWEQLLKIGYGETASYGEIAHRLGKTSAASRAVGLANGRNPIPVVIPCHRVIGANGTLTGYAGGLERKQLLLELEQDALF